MKIGEVTPPKRPPILGPLELGEPVSGLVPPLPFPVIYGGKNKGGVPISDAPPWGGWLWMMGWVSGPKPRLTHVCPRRLAVKPLGYPVLPIQPGQPLDPGWDLPPLCLEPADHHVYGDFRGFVALVSDRSPRLPFERPNSKAKKSFRSSRSDRSPRLPFERPNSKAKKSFRSSRRTTRGRRHALI